MGLFARARALDVLCLPASETGTLLDVGCGSGEFIERMHALGWEVAGVDPDPRAVAFAVRRERRVFEGTIADVPPDLRYDVIVLSHVIEHVPDPVALLRECGRRLRQSSSRIVVTTPNVKSLGHRWFGKYWRGLEVPRHLQLFSPETLAECVKRAGLSVHSLTTESRMARMIQNTSSYAQRGICKVTEQSAFDTKTKIQGYIFRVAEQLLMIWNKDAGEELFCVCRTSGSSLGRSNGAQ
jgi:2-polyprenyl-3-methyl-5-hydroxy-6-metoxy-1,4-benzoquinol methylase